MEQIEKNSIDSLEKRKDKIKWSLIIFGLISRLIFFILVGIVILVILFFNVTSPMDEIIVFWPFQVIIGNFLSLILLWSLTKRENIKFFELMNFNKKYLKKDLLILPILFIPVFILSWIGINLSALLIYGTIPPEVMFQNIPLWIIIPSIILIPLTNPLVELTTYFAYSYQRIQVLSKKEWLAIVLSSTFLALQHIGFPIILDLQFILWRFVGFIPLGIAMAIIYFKIRRFYIYLIGHFLLDLNLVLTLYFYFLGIY